MLSEKSFEDKEENSVLLKLYCKKISDNWNSWYAKFHENLRNRQFLKSFSPTQKPTPRAIINLPNAAYQLIIEDINQKIKESKSFDGHATQQYQFSHTLLKRFTGKEKGSTKKHVKQFLDAIAFFIGAKHYEDFKDNYNFYKLMVKQWEGETDIFTQPKPKQLGMGNRKNILTSSINPKTTKSTALVPLKPKKPEKETAEHSTNTENIVKVFPQGNLNLLHDLEVVLHHEKKIYDGLYNPPKLSRRERWLYTLMSVILVMLSGFLWYWLNPPTFTEADFDKIRLSIASIDQGSDEVHATVFIAYDASALKGLIPLEDLKIRAGSPLVTSQLSAWKDTLSFMYERGGAGTVQVIANHVLGKYYHFIISKHDWNTHVYSYGAISGMEWTSKNIPKKQSSQQGSFTFPMAMMPEQAQRYFMTTYAFSQEIPVSLSDFIVEARCKLIPTPLLNATCYHFSLSIGRISGSLEEEQVLLQPSVLNDGCSHWIRPHIIFQSGVSIHWKDFTTTAIRNFTQPMEKLTNWYVFKIVLKNRRLTYYFNEKPFYSRMINQLDGNINILSLHSKGLSSIDYVRVYDGAGVLRYSEEFGGEVQE